VKIHKQVTGLLVSCAVLLGGTNIALAEGNTGEHNPVDYDKEKISATLDLKHKSLALILGGGWGGGTLNYQGKNYKYRLSGVSAGGVGYVKIDSVGNVYRLNKLEDFTGRYSTGSIGITVVKGKGGTTLENANGVIINLRQKSSGLALGLALSSMTIKLVE